jgi:hypothetical protein
MGCDIHFFKEAHVNGKWVTADEWTPFDYGDDDKGVEVKWEKRFTDRNYNLFGLLSKGVRREHEFAFEPRGIPFDACPEYAEECARYGIDGHSHSYLYLHELVAMQNFLASQKVLISGMKSIKELEALRASIATGTPDWNLLYPYCQSTNAPDYEEFEIEVPASFILGDSLERIIETFEGVAGDNHRAVFFFDN